MKRKIILLCLAIVAGLNIYAQGAWEKGNWKKLNPDIYNSDGTYLSAYPASSEKGFLQTELFLLDGKLYPRLLLSGFSTYDSDFGVFALAQVGKTRNAGFTEKGYALSEEMHVSVAAGASYYFEYSEIKESFVFLGMGYTTQKSFFGPIAGFIFNDGYFDLEITGQYSIWGNFLKHYKEQGVKYFDPDSWYRIKLGYKPTAQIVLSLFSERFYLNGLLIEYELAENWAHCSSFKINAYLGQDFVYGRPSFGLGVKVMTLDR